MPKVTRICRVCGAKYETCACERQVSFRWRDVACSPECGEIYFKRVRLAREKRQGEG